MWARVELGRASARPNEGAGDGARGGTGDGPRVGSSDATREGTVVTIGRAITGCVVELLDAETLERVAPYAIGEIFVAGSFLADGYLHNQTATAASFVLLRDAPSGFKAVTQPELLLGLSVGSWSDSSSSCAAERPAALAQRFFRTGDFGYRDEHGDVHFVGRADQQVKVRVHSVRSDSNALHGVGRASGFKCRGFAIHSHAHFPSLSPPQPGAGSPRRAP